MGKGCYIHHPSAAYLYRLTSLLPDQVMYQLVSLGNVTPSPGNVSLEDHPQTLLNNNYAKVQSSFEEVQHI